MERAWGNQSNDISFCFRDCRYKMLSSMFKTSAVTVLRFLRRCQVCSNKRFLSNKLFSFSFRFQKMTFHATGMSLCKSKVTNCLFLFFFKVLGNPFLQQLPFSICILHLEVTWILLKHFRAILKKVRHFVLTNLPKILKNNGSKNGNNLFSLQNLSKKYGKIISFDLAKHSKFDFKFESLKIA